MQLFGVFGRIGDDIKGIEIEAVIDVLMAPVGDILGGVDKLIVGNPKSEVTGIAIIFMATRNVIEQAYRLGANLVIAHEGTFYRHHNFNESLMELNPVCEAKKRFIELSGLAIYRLHDYCHRYQPDLIMDGLIHLIHELGWPTHQHPGTAVFILVIEGSGTVTVNGEQTTLVKDDIISCEGDEQFSFKNTGSDKTSLHVVLSKIPDERYAQNN